MLGSLGGTSPDRVAAAGAPVGGRSRGRGCTGAPRWRLKGWGWLLGSIGTNPGTPGGRPPRHWFV
ncbi:hypothetical protein GCM10023176_33900 [Micromonospora coerulea]|uniref:Uncharacterized protein n=1 Tax=Micromonospora coerulea TaxID=47856 RepID=A0ABP8SM41_9ACTN